MPRPCWWTMLDQWPYRCHQAGNAAESASLTACGRPGPAADATTSTAVTAVVGSAVDATAVARNLHVEGVRPSDVTDVTRIVSRPAATPDSDTTVSATGLSGALVRSTA